MNNEHIYNVYQIYGAKNPPYIQGNNQYSINKHKYIDKNSYLNKLDKYYDYNIYKPKKYSPDGSHGSHSGIKVVPNRKLSPLGKKQLIKI